MASAVRLREDYSAEALRALAGGRRTSTRAGGSCRWTAWTGARRRRSAGWTARRCVTGSIASRGRVWRASSTTGRRVPSLVLRRSNWLSSRRSSRRLRILRRTGSCVGSTSSASSPRGSGVDFHPRYVGKLLKKLGFSHISVRPRHPAEDERTVEEFKKLPARAESSSRRVAQDDAGRNLV
jgi:hypothetical protein